MRASALAFAALFCCSCSCGCFVETTSAFVVPSFVGRRMPVSCQASNIHKLQEFDYLLGEGEAFQNVPAQTTTTRPRSSSSRRRVVVVMPGIEHERAIQLTSSTATFLEDEESQTEQTMSEADPYDDVFAEQLNKIEQYEQGQQQSNKGFNLQEYLKNSDLGDIIVTLVVPAIVLSAVARWGSKKAYGALEEKADVSLDGFAKEMIYHDGDFEEMKMCQADYSRRLVWLGPSKTDAMLKRYLEVYAKKKTVSPQSISSLSYVFSLFKLSEEKAAQILVSLCKQMGTAKISSAGKLLFFGSRILKSPEGKSALEPIKTLIKSTYRDEQVAETLVDTSQQAIAEAAYRAAVLDGGKSQTSLTVGWEVLGLNRETAQRIFNEEAEEGFITYREATYSGQTTKYDSAGNVLDKDGELKDPEAAAKAAEEEKEDESQSGNVFECEDCGYTLFVAQGRDFKFYGDDFKCPECGAEKEKFKSRDLDDE